MTIHIRNIPVSFLIRQSVRYLLVSNGFRLLQVLGVLAALSFVLTGNRIAEIDKLGGRADIVAAILVTIATIALLSALNRRVMIGIDRRFFRESYDAQLILTDLGEAISTLSKTKDLVELVANKISDALHPENVTIFLDDIDAGAYVAAVSFDASKAAATPRSHLCGLVLGHDEPFVKGLKKSKALASTEPTDSDPSLQDFGWEDVSVPSGYRSQTMQDVRASLLIPIASNGHLDGIISLGRRLSDLPYGKEDKRLLFVVANQVAAFIENMKLISRMAEEERNKREIEMAAEVQRHLFPVDGFENDALEIYGTCLPALGVGGDYYDYFEVDDHVTGIAIADVAGKGIGAALLMSTVQASLRCQLASGNKSLTDVVSSMNRMLRRSTGAAGYATFFLAEFDNATSRLTYVNAGHNPPLLVRSGLGLGERRNGISGASSAPVSQANSSIGANTGIGVQTGKPVIRLLTTGGPIIGTFLDEPYEQETIQLMSGDVLIVYTDGVTEALNSMRVEFGEEQLRWAVFGGLGLSAREIAQRIIARVIEWQGQASQHDDITLIVVKVH
jgi:phosphoserine phosphatase RsbU/P